MANKLRHYSERILRLTRRIIMKPLVLLYDFPGVLLEFKVTWLKRRVVFRDKFGFKFWLYPCDEVFLYWKRNAITDSIGVTNFILKHVKQGAICIDIGAAQAGITVPMWLRAGSSGKVISVEADPEKIGRIKANLELNGFSQDYVVNAAVSDRMETRPFRCYPKSSGWNTFGDPQFAKDYDSFLINVQCIDFGHLLQSYDVEFVDVAKIDTEGAELLVLKGMMSCLIKKQIGCVIFEVNPLMLPGMGVTVQALVSFWDDLPYSLYRLNEDGGIYPLSGLWPEGVVGDCVAFLDQHEKENTLVYAY